MVKSSDPLPPLLCMLKQNSMPNGEEISKRAKEWRANKKRQGFTLHNFIRQDNEESDEPVIKRMKTDQ